MRTLAVALLLAGTSTMASAASDDITFAGRISTLGLGVESSTRYFSDNLHLRAQANFGNLSRTLERNTLDYDAEFEWLSGGLMADFFLIDKLRLSLGAMVNKNRVQLAQQGAGIYKIGSRDYRAEGDFQLDGDIKFRSFAPYIGIGFGNPMSSKSRISYGVDVGVMVQGNPTAELNAKGTVTPVDSSGNAIGDSTQAEFDPTVQADLKREQDEAASDAEDLKVFPVIGFSIAYRY